ncbi:mRNA decay activator protein ZFP36L2-like [Elgaria multicarinata webbii]|uniref:mRNA decay activator protein ZFP36L2-like n=1 Tax=Elgaria multicarinata webbii TaxID=159646 RepID=UPI002FCD5FB9
MPSDCQSLFAYLDYALCKTFQGLNVNKDNSADAKIPPGFQRTCSACPTALSASSGAGSEGRDDAVSPQAAPDQSDLAWSLQGQWSGDPELPHRSLERLHFRTDRSVSLTESSRSEAKAVSSRYKTELCRTFEESGTCKYGAKCQYAHGTGELRALNRHPKYKTEPCRTFHTSGICPYGARCHFVHNADERRPPPPRNLQPLRHGSGGSPLEGPPPALPSLALVAPGGLHLPTPPFPLDALSQAPLGGSLCPLGSRPTPPAPCSGPFAFPSVLRLQKSFSADSLSDQDDSGSSGGSSGSESPGLGPLGRRLPIFSQLSVSDD